MDREIRDLVDEAEHDVLSGREVDGGVLLRFLRLDPESRECAYLGEAAKAVSMKVTEGYGHLNSSIGVDMAPCPMDCGFCSLGERWDIVKERSILPYERILELFTDVWDMGFNRFTLRTTESFDKSRLMETGRRLRDDITGKFSLGVNTGGMTPEEAEKFHLAGFNVAYHTLRLGEGVDTKFSRADRVKVMEAIAGSPLNLSAGIDPVGVEHTDKEILERIELFRRLGVKGTCSMRRKNVPGTPMEGIPEVGDKRMAQIAAVLRMADCEWNVSSSPIIPQSLEWGANSISVETGASPRRTAPDVDVWKIMGHEEAALVLENAGFKVRRRSVPP